MDSAQQADSRRYQALNHQLQAVRRYFQDGVTEFAINKPGEVWTENRGVWHRHPAPDFTFAFCNSLALAIASAAGQSLTSAKPTLSAALPSGERVQIVMPPAVPKDTISLTLRRPSSLRFTLEDYDKQGFFKDVAITSTHLLPHEEKLLELLHQRDLPAFLRLAVASKQTILLSGGTGSGKTTFAQTLIDLIPDDERLITIEDTRELEPRQPNVVRLFYSKGGQGKANIDAGHLLESCLRMKPHRILQSEVRDSAAYYFVAGTNSGHPGSITTCHANNPAAALSRLGMLMRAAPEAKGMTRADIRELINDTIDIVIQIGAGSGTRAITGIFYDPQRKYAPLA